MRSVRKYLKYLNHQMCQYITAVYLVYTFNRFSTLVLLKHGSTFTPACRTVGQLVQCRKEGNVLFNDALNTFRII